MSGDKDFRPVALARDSKGNLYITDWMLVDYPNHGKGRIWKVTGVPLPETTQDKVKPKSPARRTIVEFLQSDDPFERLWGWTYRLEAYTPAPKRIRGYYAMPILWQNDVIGWANAQVMENHLGIEIGYERRPRHLRAFKSALEQEVSSLASFLHLKPDAWKITKHPYSK